MNGEEIKAAIRQGKRVYGSLIVSTSPKWLKYIKNIGMDFVFIDTEHVMAELQIVRLGEDYMRIPLTGMSCDYAWTVEPG